MFHIPAMIRGILIRLGIAVGFSIYWYSAVEHAVPFGNALVLCGALYATGAWFSYLRLDGLKLMTTRSVTPQADLAERFRLALNRSGYKTKETPPGMDESVPFADSNHAKRTPDELRGIYTSIANGVISAVLLIGASFIFNMYQILP